MFKVDTNAMHIASSDMQKILEEGGSIIRFIEIGQSLANYWYGDNNSLKFQDALLSINENTDAQYLAEIAKYPSKVASAYEDADVQLAHKIRGMF